MNVLDWALLALVLAYAVSGYWQGFISGAFATTGLLPGRRRTGRDHAAQERPAPWCCSMLPARITVRRIGRPAASSPLAVVRVGRAQPQGVRSQLSGDVPDCG